MWNDLIQAIASSRDALTTICATVAIVVSILGLRTWHWQIQGKAQYELARRLLLAMFGVRDAVNALRSPFISRGELAEAARGAYEGEADTDVPEDDPDRLTEIAYNRRWERVRDAMSALATEEMEAHRFRWQITQNTMQGVHASVIELHAALEQYLEMRRDEAGTNDDEYDRIRRIVFRNWGVAKSSRADEFGNRFSAAITDIEAALKPYLDFR